MGVGSGACRAQTSASSTPQPPAHPRTCWGIVAGHGTGLQLRLLELSLQHGHGCRGTQGLGPTLRALRAAASRKEAEGPSSCLRYTEAETPRPGNAQNTAMGPHLPRKFSDWEAVTPRGNTLLTSFQRAQRTCDRGVIHSTHIFLFY